MVSLSQEGSCSVQQIKIEKVEIDGNFGTPEPEQMAAFYTVLMTHDS